MLGFLILMGPAIRDAYLELLERSEEILPARELSNRMHRKKEPIKKAIDEQDPGVVLGHLPAWHEFLHEWVGELTIRQTLHPLPNLSSEIVGSVGAAWRDAFERALTPKVVLISRRDRAVFVDEVRMLRRRLASGPVGDRLTHETLTQETPAASPLERLLLVLERLLQEAERENLDIIVCRAFLPRDVWVALVDFETIIQKIQTRDVAWFHERLQVTERELSASIRKNARKTIERMAPELALLKYAPDSDRLILDEDDEPFAYYVLFSAGWESSVITDDAEVARVLEGRVAEAALLKGGQLPAMANALTELAKGRTRTRTLRAVNEHLGMEDEQTLTTLSLYRRGDVAHPTLIRLSELVQRAMSEGLSVAFANG